MIEISRNSTSFILSLYVRPININDIFKFENDVQDITIMSHLTDAAVN